MEREQLYETLKTVEPALAKKDLMENITQIWFDGTNAAAFLDTGFGIIVPCKIDFKGGLKGSTLLGLLKASKAKDVAITAEEDNCLISMGKSKATLAILSSDKSPVKMPANTKMTKLTPTFIGALGKVMLSAGTPAAAIPEQAGVVLLKKDVLHIFATDDSTISWAKCPLDQAPPMKTDRVILPIQFVETLLEISKGKDTEIAINPDEAVAKTDAATVVSRIIGTDDPADLLSIGEELTKGKTLINIPPRLKLALARAFVILEGQKDEPIKLSVKNNILTLLAESPTGKLKDSMELEGKHPDVSCNVQPKLVKRALGYCTKMHLNKTSLVMQGNDTIHLIYGI